MIKVIKITDELKKIKEKQKKIMQKTVKKRIANNIRDRRGALRNISLIPDYLFRRIFTLDKASFASVLKNIYPLPEKDQQKASLNESGGVISPEIMLLATLRFLAGGMKWDICLSLDIGLDCRYLTIVVKYRIITC